MTRGGWSLVWKELTEGLRSALARAGLPAEGIERLELSVPRDVSHGDWTTNLALILAREAGQPPRAVAERLAEAFPPDPEQFDAVEVAGPGFLNFRYSGAFLERLAGRVLKEGEGFGRSALAAGTSVVVEYVSANPTGPLNEDSARAAAVGASLVRLLRATGHEAEGEFYVNDAGNQVELLGESLAARFAERVGVPRPFPEQGYQGAYLTDLAAELPRDRALQALEAKDGIDWFRDQALERILEGQRRDLADFGGEFSAWVRETSLHRSGKVGETLETLASRGMVYEKDGAKWLPSSAHGDSEDRVVVKSSGDPTYLLPDIAYHRDKRARGFRHSIDLWGPDHHGYIARLKAAMVMAGIEPDFLEVLIVQQVNLLSAGEQVKMSKRAGEFVTLRELMEEVGADCAKFFFLMRSTSAHLDFDLDLARQKNDENPAYYVQYAHARIASLVKYAAERGITPREARRAGSSLPASGEETPVETERTSQLLRRLAAFPEVVRGAARTREPHRIPTYLMETAAEFHRFYHACRVVSENLERSRSRLQICEATRQVLANGLSLMGVSAPQRMDRPAELGA